MKTDLTFLPELKQEELKQLTELIVNEMQPALIVLFGSYARGTWVEDSYSDDGVYYTYKSDYDILVVTKHDLSALKNGQWIKTEQKAKHKNFTAPVTLIQHGLGYLIKELEAGSYFFTDIIKDGILLHDNNGHAADLKPGEVDPEKVKARAKTDFEFWHTSAGEFFEGFMFYFEKGYYNSAAFQLHQTTEKYYTALLLAFTGYKPKTHDLETLGKTASAIHSSFRNVFVRDTEEQRTAFHRLLRAYIDARYKKSYIITKEDLEYLALQVSALKSLVERVCWERLEIK